MFHPITQEQHIRITVENPLLGYKRPLFKDGIKIISQKMIDSVLSETSSLEKKRDAILIHDRFNVVPQRFVNCLNPETYIRPHMHLAPNQWELMCWISGRIIALFFDDHGTIIRKIVMSKTNVRLIEVPPFIYHSFIATQPSAYLEIRNCKYQPSVDRLYSAWSPKESSSASMPYQKRLRFAKMGDTIRHN